MCNVRKIAAMAAIGLIPFAIPVSAQTNADSLRQGLMDALGRATNAQTSAHNVLAKATNSVANTTNGLANASNGVANAANSQKIGSAERLDQLLGSNIQNAQGQTAGKLDNLVVDLASGRVLYAVVDVPGVPSPGKVVLPPGEFALGGANGTNLILQADNTSLTNAPRWTSASAPELGNVSFVSSIYQHFGQQPWWTGGLTPTGRDVFESPYPARQLIGAKVKNPASTNLGTIKNLVVDLPAGRVLYVLLEPDGDLGKGNNVYPIPPNALTKGPDNKTALTGLTSEQLQNAPHFADNNWPDVGNPTYAAQVYQHYGKQPYFQ